MITTQTALKTALRDYSLPSLAAEILLAHALQTTRASLYAHPERPVPAAAYPTFLACIKRHAAGEPIAYIIGHREFWSLDLVVTPDTLVPRQETELLVEQALAYATEAPPFTLADLGTGSGAIALALAHERPAWTIYATDKSPAALQVAKTNATRLGLTQIIFNIGEWCHALPSSLKFDMLLSNPPYIAEHDPHLQQPALQYEPRLALVARDHGLSAIAHIAQQAISYLKTNGWLLLEHGHQQAEKVQALLAELGYTGIVTKNDLSGIQRVTIGQWTS